MDIGGKSGKVVEVERGLERIDVDFICGLLRQTHTAVKELADHCLRA